MQVVELAQACDSGVDLVPNLPEIDEVETRFVVGGTFGTLNRSDAWVGKQVDCTAVFAVASLGNSSDHLETVEVGKVPQMDFEVVASLAP